MSGLSDDLRNLTPDPDDQPLKIEVDEATRTDEAQVTFQTLAEEFAEHYRKILTTLPADRRAAHEQAWEEIHRSTLVYWEQTKRNGHDPATLYGWETVAAMVDVSQHMLDISEEAAEQDK